MNIEDMQDNLETCLNPVLTEGGKKKTIKINYQRMEARYVCGAGCLANEEICTGYISRNGDGCAYKQEDGSCTKPFISEEELNG